MIDITPTRPTHVHANLFLRLTAAPLREVCFHGAFFHGEQWGEGATFIEVVILFPIGRVVNATPSVLLVGIMCPL